MPTRRQVLQGLKRDELLAAVDRFDVAVLDRRVRDCLIDELVAARRVHLEEILSELARDRLKELCRALGLDDRGREKAVLVERLTARSEPARGRPTGTGTPAQMTLPAAVPATAKAPTPEPVRPLPATPPARPAEPDEEPRKGPPRDDQPRIPQRGDVVRVRQRQYLVEEVVPPPADGQATLVRLVCLDDDNQGRDLEVLWELELGTRVLEPETHGLGPVAALDPPRRFAAYLHALRWSSVTATDPRLFQAPFRAGMELLPYQLIPLRRALELPRANLFIADDVGLGKTIEAGLVLQELLLRQRVAFVLIACPAAICLQWRDEMKRRFGLHFEIYNRPFIARRRQERGFGVNPWSTHQRFIVSHQLLRRPEYREPLLRHLGERAHKSLLILDEAHVAAPAAASRYAVDSRITRVIRDVAPRFENRLLLSATPHNGHSNSFSALLEILDPQRFTRGVRITRSRDLEAVMVRRLKSDLRELGLGRIPRRRVIQLDLDHDGSGWRCLWPEDGERSVGPGEAVELLLADQLAAYTEHMQPRRGRGRLVFVSLQKRLLSSVEAFYRTLKVHAAHAGPPRGEGSSAAPPAEAAVGTWEADEDEYGPDDEAQEARDAAAIGAASGLVPAPRGEARRLLDAMLQLAERCRVMPDAKALALLDWIRRHQCPGVRLASDPTPIAAADRRWSERRVIVFTEYGDTKRYLFQLLSGAVAATDQGERRIMHFHGGMSDPQREEVRRAFNGPPELYPVRILIATDAAREGVNLQGCCTDLFHYDVPWNPARMEQRNGRIDRIQQPADEVRCHYFFYPRRREDRVLQTLVRKVEVIGRELGSLSEVIMDRLAAVMDRGIGPETPAALEAAAEAGGRREAARDELEGPRLDRRRVEREVEKAERLLNDSRQVIAFDPELLRSAVGVGLELAGAGPLTRAADGQEPTTYVLPPLGAGWQETLDGLRPPRERDEPFWEWRQRPPLPVVFEPLKRMESDRVQLHLRHPFVRRILDRFLAQGYGAEDLSRVTVVRNPGDAQPRVVAFGRLSLFGPGATRLHDELLPLAALWLGSGDPGHLEPSAERENERAVERLDDLLRDAGSSEAIPEPVRERLGAAAEEDFQVLWRHLRAVAERRSQAAEEKLAERGRQEAEALRRILEEQRRAIEATLEAGRQRALEFTEREKAQREQYEQDCKFMAERLQAIDDELDREPRQLEELYSVAVRRFEPVGMVYLWPATRC